MSSSHSFRAFHTLSDFHQAAQGDPLDLVAKAIAFWLDHKPMLMMNGTISIKTEQIPGAKSDANG